MRSILLLLLYVAHVALASTSGTPSPTTSSTSSPTIVPTAAPTFQPPKQATSRRITTQQDCAKQGRNVNCAWNPQVVVFDGYSRVCEPTNPFLEINASTICDTFSNETCVFSSVTQCVSRTETLCIFAPQWRLYERAKTLMGLADELTTALLDVPVSVYDVLQRSYKCTELTNNITCTSTPYCSWTPTPTMPAHVVTEGVSDGSQDNITTTNFTSPNFTISMQIPESQILQLTAPDVRPRPDLKRVRIVSPKRFHARLVTVTTQVRWTSTAAQASIRSGSFHLIYHESGQADVTSDAIKFNSTSGQLQSILRKIPRLQDAVVQANSNQVDEWGRRNWIVNASNAQYLDIASFAFFDKDGNSLIDVTRVSITRHQRNRQILMMFGTSKPSKGTFSLAYRWIDFPPEWKGFQNRTLLTFPAFGTQLPIPSVFSVDESASSFQAKLNAFFYQDTKMLDWVTVSRADNSTVSRLAAKASALGIAAPGQQLWGAWSIEFTTLVSEYERAEFPLTVVSSPLAGSNSTQFGSSFGVTAEDGSLISFSVQVDVSSPVAHGQLGKPQFWTAGNSLPGLFQANKTTPTILASTRNVSLDAGDCLKLGGRYYYVTGTSFSNSSEYPSHIMLSQPVVVQVHVNDTSYMGSAGLQAFKCQPILPTVDVPPLKVYDNSTTANATFWAAGDRFFTGLNVIESSNSPYGESTWNLSIEDGDGEVPRLQFLPSNLDGDLLLPSCSLWNPGNCATTVVETLQTGIASPSGYFRIFFAGYGGHDSDYVRMFDEASPLINPSSQLDDGSGKLEFVNSDSTVTTIYYSAPLPVIGFATQEVITAALKTLTGNVVQLLSSAFLVETISATQIRIKFLLNSIDFAGIRLLPANVPQLAPVSYSKRPSGSRGVLGTDAVVQVFTEVQGVGNLYERVATFERAVSPLASPCMANSERRRVDFGNAYGDYASLEQLDTNAVNCAVFGGVSRQTCVGPDAIVEGCAWRGSDAPLLLEPPIGVDPNFLTNFWQTDDMFKLGPLSITVNSECTLSLTTTINAQLRMLKPLATTIKTLNSSQSTPGPYANHMMTFISLYNSLTSDAEKFDRCGRNPVVEAKATQGAFVDVWQWLVTTTSYTCMLAYGLAGALLAYRMDKFNLLGFRGWDAFTGVMIILGSTIAGAIFGFAIGAVPAALISQMYASIPVALSVDWAISLGVAQGILIVYFDMGRGGTEAENAFKHGN